MEQDIRKSIKVSVIIPVWNPGPGISRCIASLRRQTLSDIELIFVDDCGTDDSMEQVRAAAVEDDRIRILKNSCNIGPGASRNAGIEAAEGEYLSFIDADDYVDPGFLEELYGTAVRTGADIVRGDFCEVSEDGSKTSDFPNSRLRKNYDSGKPLFFAIDTGHFTLLIRRSLILERGVRYGLSSNGEDSTFLLRLFHTGGSFAMCDSQVLYYHVYREYSAKNIYSAGHLRGRLEGFKDQLDFLKSCPADEAHNTYVNRRIRYYLSIQLRAKRTEGQEAAAEDFLRGLRQLAMQYPGIDSITRNNRTIRVFVKMGINIVGMPYYTPFETPAYSMSDIVIKILRSVKRRICNMLTKQTG